MFVRPTAPSNSASKSGRRRRARAGNCQLSRRKATAARTGSGTVRDVRSPVLDPVDDGAAALVQSLLQPADERLDAAEACVDALPPGGDQVDEQREIVDACVTVGQRVALEVLEPPQD